jgi:hypothetical protein
MTVGNTSPPASGFCEISSFSQFDYHRDTGLGITMRLPLMPIYTMYPGDYWTRDVTLADAAEGERRWRESGSRRSPDRPQHGVIVDPHHGQDLIVADPDRLFMHLVPLGVPAIRHRRASC